MIRKPLEQPSNVDPLPIANRHECRHRECVCPLVMPTLVGTVKREREREKKTLFLYNLYPPPPSLPPLPRQNRNIGEKHGFLLTCCCHPTNTGALGDAFRGISEARRDPYPPSILPRHWEGKDGCLDATSSMPRECWSGHMKSWWW